MSQTSLLSTVEVKPYPGWGGKRAGAGRKPQVALQTKRAEALAKQLQAAVRLGLTPLLEAYPELIKDAIKLARDGNDKVLMFLIALPLKMADLDDLKADSGGDRILKDLLGGHIGTANVQINLGTDARPHVDGTWREADAGAVSPTEVGSS